jgi:hypothetical protein
MFMGVLYSSDAQISNINLLEDMLGFQISNFKFLPLKGVSLGEISSLEYRLPALSKVEGSIF